MYLCLNCLEFRVNRLDNQLICQSCNYVHDYRKYLKLKNEAKVVVRFGWQYRKREEYEEKVKVRINRKRHYYLQELNDAFSFLALAVISGVSGNYVYDILKERLNKVKNNSLIIDIRDPELKRLLESELQQKKFIRYIEDYRRKVTGDAIQSLRKKKNKSKGKKNKKNIR